MDTFLREKFNEYWEILAYVDRPNYRDNVYEYLIYCYSDPRRFYHNVEHITQCIKRVKDFDLNPVNNSLVGISLFFHDLVYNSESKLNEEWSMILTKNFLKDCINSQYMEIIQDNILLTKHIHAPLEPAIAKFVLDIDLAGLGSDYLTFSLNTQKIRQEFNHLTNEQFYSGRKQFFEFMLAKPCIYFTMTYYNKYELSARSNMTKELTEINEYLKAKGI